MYVIGVTGGIASGKSSVSAILQQQGAYIIDVDQIAYTITLPGHLAWQEIIAAFGQEVVLPDDNINRKKLGEIIFHDNNLRAILEGITHPKIKADVSQKLKIIQSQGVNLAVLDVPLLIEVGWQMLADEIWVVAVDEKTQLARLMARNSLTKEQAQARIAAQMSLANKLKYADVVIDNNGSIENTKSQVIKAWNQAKERLAGSFLS